jgi:hypothetical protein
VSSEQDITPKDIFAERERQVKNASVFRFMSFYNTQTPESKLDTIAAFYLLPKVSALFCILRFGTYGRVQTGINLSLPPYQSLSLIIPINFHSKSLPNTGFNSLT